MRHSDKHGNVHYTMHAILHNVLHNMLQWLHMLVLQNRKGGWRNGDMDACSCCRLAQHVCHQEAKGNGTMQQPKQSLQNACMHAKDCTATLSAGAAQVGKTESFGAASNSMPLLCLEHGTALSEIGWDSAVPSSCVYALNGCAM